MNKMIPSAINLPAQTFYQTLPTLVPILQQYVHISQMMMALTSRYSHVVFHCGSSQGRGPRSAAWYQDATTDSGVETNAYVLEGGIKAYHEKYPETLLTI